MANIPDLAQQPQPRAQLNIAVDPEKITFIIDLGNGAAITQAVDNTTMMGIFVNFLKLHPELVGQFIKQVKQVQSMDMDIIRTVNATKNG